MKYHRLTLPAISFLSFALAVVPHVLFANAESTPVHDNDDDNSHIIDDDDYDASTTTTWCLLYYVEIFTAVIMHHPNPNLRHRLTLALMMMMFQ
mmetsp:Transcript_15126/g.32088  ORF Transcript_15126/g.32088 Transcript_15126/m.32088 type:complete len:94 (+) Transcript_15126:122-403(+)